MRCLARALGCLGEGIKKLEEQMAKLMPEELRRLRYLHNSFSYIVSHLWNNLPVDIKETDSLAIFKNKLHNVVLSKAACLCSSCS